VRKNWAPRKKKVADANKHNNKKAAAKSNFSKYTRFMGAAVTNNARLPNANTKSSKGVRFWLLLLMRQEMLSEFEIRIAWSARYFIQAGIKGGIALFGPSSRLQGTHKYESIRQKSAKRITSTFDHFSCRNTKNPNNRQFAIG